MEYLFTLIEVVLRKSDIVHCFSCISGSYQQSQGRGSKLLKLF